MDRQTVDAIASGLGAWVGYLISRGAGIGYGSSHWLLQLSVMGVTIAVAMYGAHMWMRARSSS